MKGAKRLSRKLRKDIPESVRRAVKPAIAKQAQRISNAQKALAPGWIVKEMGWREGGAAPGDVFAEGGEDSDAAATIFVRDFRARWFEFGTAPRVQKTTGRAVGRITAQPFFYPAWRLYKKPAGAAIRRALRKAIRDGARK